MPRQEPPGYKIRSGFLRGAETREDADVRKPVCLIVFLVLLASTGFAAAVDDESAAAVQAAKAGFPIVKLAKIFTKPLTQQPVPLPTPIDPSVLASHGFTASQGPVAQATSSGRAVGMGGAGLMLSSRGGGFSSPRQRADREIRQLIRRLD